MADPARGAEGPPQRLAGTDPGRRAGAPDRLVVRTGALATRVLFGAPDTPAATRSPSAWSTSPSRTPTGPTRRPPTGEPPTPVQVRARREVILCRRRVQHPAAAQALRHRAAGGAGAVRHPGPRRPAGRRGEPAGPLRGRRRHPDARATSRCSTGLTFRPPARRRGARSRLPRVAGRARASTRPTGRCSGIIRRSRPGAGRARPVHLRPAGEVHRLLPGLLRRARPADRRLHLGDPQGAHGQPGRQGAAALGRPARHPRHPLPLLRRGRRRGGGGPRRRRHRHRARPLDHGRPRRTTSPRSSCPAREVDDAGGAARRSCGTTPGATTPPAPCAIGRAADPRAVVDSDFRVHGTRGLRVVDASVFPRIPGFFIVTAIYMAAEKASAAILADAAAAAATPPSRHRPAARPRPAAPSAQARPLRPPSRRSDEHRDPRSDSIAAPPCRSRAPTPTGTRRAAGRPRRRPSRARTTGGRCSGAIYDRLAQAVDHTARLGQAAARPAGLAVLIGVRTILRQKNLHDPSTVVPIVNGPTGAAAHAGAPGQPQRRRLVQRPRPPGRWAWPAPGSAATSRWTRCCRSPASELMEPNPREVSRRLLTRDAVPAGDERQHPGRGLAAVHDPRLVHPRGGRHLAPGRHPAAARRRLAREPDAHPADQARPDPAGRRRRAGHHGQRRDPLVGRLVAVRLDARRSRSWSRSGEDGKLRLTDDGQLPIPDDPALDPTHEARLVDRHGHADHAVRPRAQRRLRPARGRSTRTGTTRSCSSGPGWWSPPCSPRSTPPSGRRRSSATRRRSTRCGPTGSASRASGSPAPSAGSATARSSAASPGAATEHYGVPFSLTEEFTSVYRMHPLLPDDFDLRSVGRRRAAGAAASSASSPARTRRRSSATYALGDLFYSFGTTHPGAIVLRNYPKFLQEYERPGRQGHRPRRPPTSCGSASSASRGTASSAGSCT